MASILCLGGLDPSGGAGLLRDAWTLRQRDPSGSFRYVVTAWTRQGDGRPARVQARPPSRVLEDLQRVRASCAGSPWLKIGLLPSGTVEPLAKFLEAASFAGVVLDPVLRASDGGQLGAAPGEFVSLRGKVSLWTPNPDESRRLGGSKFFSDPCLFKSAFRSSTEIGDRLVVGDTVHEFRRPLQAGPDPRGTGCALATAITNEGASGRPLPEACQTAIAWLERARSKVRVASDGRHHFA